VCRESTRRRLNDEKKWTRFRWCRKLFCEQRNLSARGFPITFSSRTRTRTLKTIHQSTLTRLQSTCCLLFPLAHPHDGRSPSHPAMGSFSTSPEREPTTQAADAHAVLSTCLTRLNPFGVSHSSVFFTSYLG
jgi:hypothetical protein